MGQTIEIASHHDSANELEKVKDQDLMQYTILVKLDWNLNFRGSEFGRDAHWTTNQIHRNQTKKTNMYIDTTLWIQVAARNALRVQFGG